MSPTDKFDFPLKDKDFENLVKKARRKVITRTIIIATLVSVIISYGLYVIGSYVMQQQSSKQMVEDTAWHEIHGANVHVSSTIFNYGFFTSTSETALVKKVGKVIVPWGEDKQQYTLFGTSKTISTPGAYGEANLGEPVQLYFNGERVISFYHPSINYMNMTNDFSSLQEIDNNKLVELALSFDKPYSLDEVKKDFKNEDLSWFWIDTYGDIKSTNEPESGPFTGESVYGFANSTNPENKPEEMFLRNLRRLEASKDYGVAVKEVKKAITNQKDQEPKVNNLKVLGVVVTGSPEEMKKYEKNPKVRTASLGATVEKY